ncbi:MAG: response regulator [Gammaproteobacteria bacterium]|nr:response regulator [Gammaproteobacteria bacterium]
MVEEKLYTTREVADLVGVSSRTVQLWASAGVVTAWKTPGGHRRFSEVEVQRLQDQLGGVPATGRHKILVVEDEPDLQMLYRLSIESWIIPVEVVTARDAYEGLLKIGVCKPLVIIFDVMMPQSDGFRMLEVITTSDQLRDSLVIVVSDMSADEIRSRAGIPESVRIYARPIPFGVIRQQVSAHLESLPSR